MARSRILEMMGKSQRIECFTMKFHSEFLDFKTLIFKKCHSAEFAIIYVTYFS